MTHSPESSGNYQIPSETSLPFDVDALALYDHPMTGSVVQAFENGIVEDVGKYGPNDERTAHKLIKDYTEAIAFGTRDAYQDDVIRRYPHHAEQITVTVPTEGEYVVRQNGDHRRNMRLVYQQTVSDQRNRLIASTTSDVVTKNQARTTGITQERVIEVFEKEAAERQAAVKNQAEKIFERVAQRKTESVSQKIGAKVLAKLRRSGDLTTTVYPDDLGDELSAFVKLLFDYQNKSIASVAAESFYSEIKAQVSQAIHTRFNKLTENSLVRLGSELETAYTNEKRKTRKRKPSSPQVSAAPRKEKAAADEVTQDSAAEDAGEQTQVQLTDLRTIESPFDWCPGELKLQQATGYGKKLVICEALIDGTQKRLANLWRKSIGGMRWPKLRTVFYVLNWAKIKSGLMLNITQSTELESADSAAVLFKITLPLAQILRGYILLKAMLASSLL